MSNFGKKLGDLPTLEIPERVGDLETDVAQVLESSASNRKKTFVISRQDTVGAINVGDQIRVKINTDGSLTNAIYIEASAAVRAVSGQRRLIKRIAQATDAIGVPQQPIIVQENMQSDTFDISRTDESIYEFIYAVNDENLISITMVIEISTGLSSDSITIEEIVNEAQ